MPGAHSHNERAWDERAQRRQRHTRVVTDKELRDPLKAVDPEGWLNGNIQRQKVLCLAAGGGLQSILYAKAGGEVTVVDLSSEMLVFDEKVSRERGVKVRCLQASMDDLSALADAQFDLVIQPVSTCYVPDIRPVYREVARVMKPGGLYISQHKQPINLQAGAVPGRDGHYPLTEAYERSGPLPPAPDGLMHREAGTVEYLHRWNELVGELCRAGFVLEDLSEPKHFDAAAQPGTAPHRYCFAPPYVKFKARRNGGEVEAAPKLWLPGR